MLKYFPVIKFFMSKKVLSLCLGIFIILLIFSRIGILDILKIISKMNIGVFLAAVLVDLAVITMFSKRFQILVNRHKPLSFVDSFKITMIGIFFNLITPVAKLGGEPVKIFLLRQKKIATEKSSAIVFTNLIIELLTLYLFFLSSVIILVLKSVVPSSLLRLFVVFLFISLILFVAGIKLLLNYNFIKKIVNWILNRLKRKKKKNYARLFQKYFKVLLKDKSTMIKLVLFSLFIKLMELMRIYLIFWAIGIKPDIYILLIVWATVLVFGMVPFLPGNLGLIEGGVISALILAGVSSYIAASYIFLDRLIIYWFNLFIGLGILVKSGLIKYKVIRNELASRTF